jgi:hypothetical protein
MWLAQASQTTTLTAGSRPGTAAAPGRFPVFIPCLWLLTPPREDVRRCFSAEAQRPMTHDARAAAGWSPNAPQTASESRWRVSARIGHPPASCQSGESCAGFWAKRALARKRHHLGPPLRRNPLLVIERGSPIRACRSATVVLNILNGPRGARAEFLAPHVTHGRKRPQSVAGASPVRQFDSLGARSGTSAGTQLRFFQCTC